MRLCTKCGSEKPSSDFARRTSGGRSGYQSWCRDCHKAYQNGAGKRPKREYRNKRRESLKAEIDLIKSAPCSDCGQTFPTVCMDFDHIRGEKLGNIATMINNCTSRESIFEEIAKCELVCANCHRLRTHQRRLEKGVI